MATHSSMLHVRMDTEMKQQATAALAAMGLTASEAVRPALPSHRRRSSIPARTEGSQRANAKRPGRNRRDGEVACGTIRRCG